MFDVIVVGGGPTGLMLASELRLHGVQVLVLEKDAAPPPFVRSLGLHVRTLEILDSRGLLERFLAVGKAHPLAGMFGGIIKPGPLALDAAHGYILGIPQLVAKAEKPMGASECPRTRNRNEKRTTGEAAPHRGPLGGDRIDWASLLRRTYKVDVLSCRRCGGKAKVLAVIEDDAVVKKILSHLGLRTEALPLAPMRPPAQRELSLVSRVDVDEEPRVEDLPAWMREVPARARMRARGPRELHDEDEVIPMENLPAWMRSVPLVTDRRRPRWAHRRWREEEWLDEVVPVERLPPWMRQGSWVGPAPPNWECIDVPSPGAEALVDPIYDEPSS